MRGAKAASPLMQLKPSSRCPALQYLDDVDKGGVADVAGLKKGDFLLAVSLFFFSYKICYSRILNKTKQKKNFFFRLMEKM